MIGEIIQSIKLGYGAVIATFATWIASLLHILPSLAPIPPMILTTVLIYIQIMNRKTKAAKDRQDKKLGDLKIKLLERELDE